MRLLRQSQAIYCRPSTCALIAYVLQLTISLAHPQLCPDYAGLELGIGESLLVKAIAESTGRSPAKIKESLKKEGDLGKVAMVGLAGGDTLLTLQLSRNTQPTMFKPKALTVPFVFQNLTDIAKCTGNAVSSAAMQCVSGLT